MILLCRIFLPNILFLLGFAVMLTIILKASSIGLYVAKRVWIFGRVFVVWISESVFVCLNLARC